MRRPILAVVFFLLIGQPLGAQLVVNDPANTARNAISAILKEYLLNAQRDQHSQLRRMSQRLSLLTNLAKYAPLDPPRKLPVYSWCNPRRAIAWCGVPENERPHLIPNWSAATFRRHRHRPASRARP